MSETRPIWWDTSLGKIAAAVVATVSAGIITAVVLGAGAWAVAQDRQSTRINMGLEVIQGQLDRQSLQLTELNLIEKRVTRIEDSRFTDEDADIITKRYEDLRLRVSALELGR